MVKSNKTKLFCIPHAGGSSNFFSSWKNLDSSVLEIVQFELKGRNNRYKEGMYNDFNEAILDICSTILNDSKENEYALFGHSMGGYLAYEVYKKMVEIKKPRMLFLSSIKPLDNLKKLDYPIDNKDLYEYLLRLKGTPKILLDSKEYQNYYFPIYRNDLNILHGHDFGDTLEKITCSVNFMYGKEEQISKDDINYWRTKCTEEFFMKRFSGDHFYIKQNQDKTFRYIEKVIYCSKK